MGDPNPPRNPEASVDLYRLLVEAVKDYAIFVLDTQGRIQSWNPGAERLKGYRREEILGKHFSIFYPEEVVRSGKVDEELRVATAEGRFEDEGWRLRKDGSRFWANVVITALRDEHGDLLGFAKITRDLTARRESEAQARRLAAEQAERAAAEARNRELMELTARLEEQALELELQTHEAQALTEELEQTNEELQTALEEAEAARAKAQHAEQYTRYLAKASEVLGSSLDYETTLGELARVVVPELADWCTVDVLSQEGEARQLAVAHVNPEKVIWAKQLRERYPPDPNATTGVPNVLRTGKPELYPEIPAELLEAGAVDDTHRQIIRELGLRSAIVVPLVARDRVLGALTLVSAQAARRYTEADLELVTELARRAALAVDNAQLHRAEREAKQIAENANEAKTQFLAVMSHELRTPLNAIAGYTELLMMGLRGPVSGEQREYLERIQRSQRHLLSLINDVLNYAKLESGHVTYALTRLVVDDALAEVEELVLPQLKSKNITLEYAPCDRDVAVDADAEKVRQILINLMSNAIKFTQSRGAISIWCRADAEMVRISVRDTGVGIPAEKLGSIFEPFIQLGRALASTVEGTGLGLSISRDLARGMGGDLSVESTVGTGSTFTLTLPRSR